MKEYTFNMDIKELYKLAYIAKEATQSSKLPQSIPPGMEENYSREPGFFNNIGYFFKDAWNGLPYLLGKKMPGEEISPIKNKANIRMANMDRYADPNYNGNYTLNANALNKR